MPATVEIMQRLERRVAAGELKGGDDLGERDRRGRDRPACAAAEARIDVTARPTVILVVGVNGTGKTTTIGKLAEHLRRSGATVVVGAADTFRAAAGEQLETWAERAKADFVGSTRGQDPAAVAFDAVSAAEARGRDVVLVDTAGRLHTQINLMEELSKVRRVISGRLEGAPHETLLVIDATTGQNGLQQARLFSQAVPVTGVALTKLDGTAKGGVAIAIAHELGLPIKLIGVGETLEDLRPFVAEDFARALFASLGGWLSGAAARGDVPPALVWLRRDLRLDDQPAIAAALEDGGPVACAFVLDEGVYGGEDRAAPRVQFALDGLRDLDGRLRERGGGLFLRRGDGGGGGRPAGRRARRPPRARVRRRRAVRPRPRRSCRASGSATTASSSSCTTT